MGNSIKIRIIKVMLNKKLCGEALDESNTADQWIIEVRVLSAKECNDTEKYRTIAALKNDKGVTLVRLGFMSPWTSSSVELVLTTHCLMCILNQILSSPLITTVHQGRRA